MLQGATEGSTGCRECRVQYLTLQSDCHGSTPSQRKIDFAIASHRSRVRPGSQAARSHPKARLAGSQGSFADKQGGCASEGLNAGASEPEGDPHPRTPCSAGAACDLKLTPGLYRQGTGAGKWLSMRRQRHCRSDGTERAEHSTGVGPRLLCWLCGLTAAAAGCSAGCCRALHASAPRAAAAQ